MGGFWKTGFPSVEKKAKVDGRFYFDFDFNKDLVTAKFCPAANPDCDAPFAQWIKSQSGYFQRLAEGIKNSKSNPPLTEETGYMMALVNDVWGDYEATNRHPCAARNNKQST